MAQMNTKLAVERSQRDVRAVGMQTLLGRKRMLRGEHHDEQ